MLAGNHQGKRLGAFLNPRRRSGGGLHLRSGRPPICLHHTQTPRAVYSQPAPARSEVLRCRLGAEMEKETGPRGSSASVLLSRSRTKEENPKSTRSGRIQRG